MINCVILGDSIAQGVHHFRPSCLDYAHPMWNSEQWNLHYRNVQFNANSAVISLGTNDTTAVDTKTELNEIRSRIKAKTVFWILPVAVHPKSGTTVSKIRKAILAVASRYKDYTVEIPLPTGDRYHPSGQGYQILAEKTSR